jgi:ferredoxin
MCALVAPEVFDQDRGDGRVILLNPTPPPDHHHAVQLAIQACPCGVITEEPDPT